MCGGFTFVSVALLVHSSLFMVLFLCLLSLLLSLLLLVSCLLLVLLDWLLLLRVFSGRRLVKNQVLPVFDLPNWWHIACLVVGVVFAAVCAVVFHGCAVVAAVCTICCCLCGLLFLFFFCCFVFFLFCFVVSFGSPTIEKTTRAVFDFPKCQEQFSN